MLAEDTSAGWNADDEAAAPDSTDAAPASTVGALLCDSLRALPTKLPAATRWCCSSDDDGDVEESVAVATAGCGGSGVRSSAGGVRDVSSADDDDAFASVTATDGTVA